jgi:C-terminal processing protease CtpA/Prc
VDIRDDSATEIWCDSGARVRLFVGTAHALIGIGLYYETQGGNGVRVTRVVGDSPASRAGLGPGDRILAIQGQPVASMDALQVRSAINENSRKGLKLDVWFMSGKRHVIELQDGAVYPLGDDDLKLEK